MNFENKIYEGIFYSQFVASWFSAYHGDNIRSKGYRKMVEWLMSLIINGKQMDNKTAREIADMAYNGKFELEEHAELFLKEA